MEKLFGKMMPKAADEMGLSKMNYMGMGLRQWIYLGLQKEELLFNLEYGGVGAYIGDAERGNINLFI